MTLVYPQFPRLADIAGGTIDAFNQSFGQSRDRRNEREAGPLFDQAFGQYLAPQQGGLGALAPQQPLQQPGQQPQQNAVQRAPLPGTPGYADHRVNQAHGLQSLIQSESGGRWNAQNNAVGAGGQRGHYGRLQFGHARLADAKRAGVIPANMTPEQFMASPEVQQRVEQWHFADIDREAQKRGLMSYVGQNVGGATITPDGIRNMAHLGGIAGAERYLKSGGRYNPADANGTRLSDYARMGSGGGAQQALESMAVGETMGQAPMQGQQMAQMGMPQGQMPMPDRDTMRQLFANPVTRPLAIQLAQAAMQQHDPMQQLQMQKLMTDIQRAQQGGDVRYGLNPVWGTDAEGNPSLGVLGNDGTFRQVDTGEFQPSTGVQRIDLGDRIMLQDARSGQVIGVESKGGSPSADQRPTGEGGLEAIPGSTLDLNRQGEAAAAEQQRLLRERTLQHAGQTVLRSVTRALDDYLPNVAQGEGVVGANLRRTARAIPGTSEYNLQRQIDDMSRNIGLDRLQQMREMSPTGGALGQVPVQQQVMLEETLGSFDVTQPVEVIEENLRQLNNIYLDIMFGSREEREFAIREGRMTPEQSAEIDSMYYGVSFDRFGRRSQGGVPEGVDPQDWEFMTPEERRLFQ